MKETYLVRGCKKGDPAAQRELYALFADKMFRVAFRYIKNQAEAEDVIIKAFTKIFNAIDSFTYKGEGSLEAWIRKVVVNEALMCLRSTHNFNLSESLSNEIPESDLSEFSQLEAEDITKMISDLPTGYRTVFNLYVIEGYTHQEIAEQLSITDSTSRTQLFKAKALLKKALNKEGFQYGT